MEKENENERIEELKEIKHELKQTLRLYINGVGHPNRKENIKFLEQLIESIDAILEG